MKKFFLVLLLITVIFPIRVMAYPTSATKTINEVTTSIVKKILKPAVEEVNPGIKKLENLKVTDDVIDNFAKTSKYSSKSIDEIDNSFKAISKDIKIDDEFKTLDKSSKLFIIEMMDVISDIDKKMPGKSKKLIGYLGLDGVNLIKTYEKRFDVEVPGIGKKILIIIDDLDDIKIKNNTDIDPSDFVNVLRKMGIKTVDFYEQYIKPNKKAVIGTGILAAYLASPESFHDAAGAITKFAADKFLEAGIQIADKSIVVPFNVFVEKLLNNPFKLIAGLFIIFITFIIIIPVSRNYLFRKIVSKYENVFKEDLNIKKVSQDVEKQKENNNER